MAKKKMKTIIKENLTEDGYYADYDIRYCPKCGEYGEWNDWFEQYIADNHRYITMEMYADCPSCGCTIRRCYKAFEINAFEK